MGLGCARACGEPHVAPPPPEMVRVPSGEIEMGCDDAKDPQCDSLEQPAHRVWISEFLIDRTEVTQAAYARCLAAGSCGAPRCEWAPNERADEPVRCVTWAQARAYCAWAGKRLPSEAEWEKAARGSDGRRYPWGNAAPTCALASYVRCGVTPAAVGAHPSGASPYGALDMAGNVDEWVEDWYSTEYYRTCPARDPLGPSSGMQRVVRGGAYDPWHMRSASRNAVAPDTSEALIGFRCAFPASSRYRERSR